jgi:hypothetical protein
VRTRRVAHASMEPSAPASTAACAGMPRAIWQLDGRIQAEAVLLHRQHTPLLASASCSTHPHCRALPHPIPLIRPPPTLGDVFIPRGVAVPALDQSIAWEFAPTGFKVGAPAAWGRGSSGAT